MVPVLLLAVLVTSTISGVLGMAGGVLLMAVLGLLLPVPAAMFLHGVCQAAANGSRALLHRRHVRLDVLGPYLAGSLACLALFRLVAWVPERGGVLLALGAMPFLARLVRPSPWLDLETRAGGVVCGLVVTAAQLLAGASGPLLDVFLLRSRMDRHGILATKAVTQTCGHLLKLVHYGALVAGAGLEGELSGRVLLALVLASFTGSALGKRLLARLTEGQFRALASRVVLLLGALLMLRGLRELIG